MRSLLFVVVALAFAAGAVAQTYRVRAPAFERLTMERLRIWGSRPQTRAVLFPCKPAGQGCASNPLSAGRVVFEGPASEWEGFELCRMPGIGTVCVPLEQAFGAPPR